jgi:hypothetical protein
VLKWAGKRGCPVSILQRKVGAFPIVLVVVLVLDFLGLHWTQIVGNTQIVPIVQRTRTRTGTTTSGGQSRACRCDGAPRVAARAEPRPTRSLAGSVP